MQAYLNTLGRKSLKTFITLMKIMLPVMILVRLGDQIGLTDWLGQVLVPVMSLVGLPPEAGLVWGISLLIGTYGGLGAYLTLLPGMEISVAQHSILCAMMLIAHMIPVEQAIVSRAGASFWITSAVRIGGALLFGAIIWQICQATGWLSEPLNLTWAPEISAKTGWADWAIGTASSMLSILMIIIMLFILLDGLEKIGVIRHFTRLLEPLLRVIGIDPRLAPLTTIGLLLGITYGGGLLIQATQEQVFSPKAKLLALSLISLCHAIIEDTLLFIAFGADIWIVLVARIIFTLAFIAIMARLLNIWPSMDEVTTDMATEPVENPAG